MKPKNTLNQTLARMGNGDSILIEVPRWQGTSRKMTGIRVAASRIGIQIKQEGLLLVDPKREFLRHAIRITRIELPTRKVSK